MREYEIMQCVSIHIWKPHEGYVGHTSLSVKLKGHTVRYLSFWPTSGKGGKGAASTDIIVRRSLPGALMERYADDFAGEGGIDAHYTVDLFSPAQPLLNAYIARLIANTPSYTIYKVNCSYIVAKALYAATGIKHNFSLHATYQTPNTKIGALYRGVWTPMMVYKYAKQLKDAEPEPVVDDGTL
jgi:hypothetical protein